MRFLKPAIFFYNSILILAIITNGVLMDRANNLAPMILLLPVALHYLLAFVDQITQLSKYLDLSKKILLLRKSIAVYSFAMVLLFIISNLASSSNWLQATITIFLLPLLISFIIEVRDYYQSPNSMMKIFASVFKATREKQAENKLEPTKPSSVKKSSGKKAKSSSSKDNIGGEVAVISENLKPILDTTNVIGSTDVNRRQFLKILGGGGISLIFMLFFMPQKANAAFFGSTPGPGIVGLKDTLGNKIDPAEKQPTDGYSISEVDDASTPGYYGFVNNDGAWYIAREDSSGSYRYANGSSGFSSSWTGRAGLSYDYFDAVF